MNASSYETLIKTTRYHLLGRSEIDPCYYRVLEALEVALKYHTGVRKDKKTKEMYHQLNIFSYLLNLTPMMTHPVEVLIVSLLHDTYEDYSESHQELMEKFPDLIHYVIRISKVRNGQKIGYDQYFGEMQDCPVTSIVKAVDRIHNLSTMQGVFSEEKQVEYMKEVHVYFLPMIKKARRSFPEQTNVYEMLKSTLHLLTHAISKEKGVDLNSQEKIFKN